MVKLFSVLFLFLAGLTAGEVTYIEIPVTAADFSVEKVNALRGILLPTEGAAGDFLAWRSPAEWYVNNFWGPIQAIPSDPSKPTKLWNLRPTSAGGKVLQFATNADGSLKRRSITAASGGNVTNLETFVAPGQLDNVLQLQVIGADTLNFFAEWGGHFEADGVPVFEWKEYSDDQAHTVNFGGTGFAQIPLGFTGVDPYHVSTWNQGYVAVFHPVTKKPCIIKIADAVKNLPRRAPGATAVSNTTVRYRATDTELGALARMLVTLGTVSDSDLGKAVGMAARATQ